MPTQRENNRGGNRGGLPTGPQPVVIKQSNFGGGEIGPNIEPRDDAGKRRQGVQQAKNFVVTFGGTLEKRPGLQIAEVNPDTTQYEAPRIWQWTGARGEPDFLMHFHPGAVPADVPDPLPEGRTEDSYRPAMLSFMAATGDWVASQGGTEVNEIETPWLWSDVWQTENDEDTASNPGVKFAQSGDVMTCTHPGYPVHQIERVPVGDMSDGDRFAQVASADTGDSVPFYTWIVIPSDFSLQQPPPTSLYIKDYRARSRSQGFDPAYANHVDYAVTAVSDRLGESHPALAKNDGRLRDPKYNIGEEMRRAPSGGERIVNLLGIDVFDDHPGLHVRVSEIEGLDPALGWFTPGAPCYIRLTKGTRGLEDFVFQVREIRRDEPGTSDDRARLYPAVSGVPGSSRSEYGYSGPWVVLEPTPNPKTYEGLWSRRTDVDPDAAEGTVAGPLLIGDSSLPVPYDPDTPLGDSEGS